ATVQQWLPFAPVVLLSFSQYMKSLNFPLKDKILALLEQGVQQALAQQQMMQEAMAMQAGAQGLPAGPGAGAGGGGGEIPPAPAGAIGGPPTPIEGPPPLPPGAPAANALP